MPFMQSPSREGRKRREREASLSPRPKASTQERLPSIHHLLPDLPPTQTESKLSHLRSPLQIDPTGPDRSSALPASLTPPSATRRNHYSGPGGGNSYQTEERDSRRSSYEASSSHSLPMHGGPPSTRYSYSSSSSQRAPLPPYARQDRDAERNYTDVSSDARAPARDYRSSDYSQALPPPSAPYNSTLNGHVPYPPGRDSRNAIYDDHRYYADPHLDLRYAPATEYRSHANYPPPPHGTYYHYQNGYGGFQFEQEHVGGQQPRRRRGNLPRDTTDILKTWFSEHLGHPYPTEDEKQMLCNRTGLAMTQISNWFINARRRRIPELMNQAQAEKRLRENSGESNSSSDS